jgi:oligopeptidase A
MPRLVKDLMTEQLTDNPLLIERFPIQFEAVKADHVEPAIQLLLEQMNQRLVALGGPDTPRTYQDILLALDQMTEPLDFAMALVRHLESVVTTPELRAAHNAVQGPVSAFYTSIALNANLWKAVQAVNESGEKEKLAPVHRRYLDKTVTGFRRAGADLDEAGKKQLEELDVALTKATTKFSENVLDATNAYEFLIADESKLAGLPESARLAARASAQSKGREGWRLTLQGPSYTAALTYLDDQGIRRDLWEASNTRADFGDPYLAPAKGEASGLSGFCQPGARGTHGARRGSGSGVSRGFTS